MSNSTPERIDAAVWQAVAIAQGIRRGDPNDILIARRDLDNLARMLDRLLDRAKLKEKG